MSYKYDISNTYVSEMSKMQTLVALGTGRSASSGTYTSPSSGITYTYTNETNLMQQLQSTPLAPYLVTANDYNSLLLGNAHYFASTTGNDSYSISGYGVTSYTNGMIVILKPDVDNTDSATLSIDGLSAKNINKYVGSGVQLLGTGDMKAFGVYILVYKSSSDTFILTNPTPIVTSLLTTQGDLIYASTAQTPARLPKGTAYKSLNMKSDATIPEWQDSIQSLMTAKGDIIVASTPNTPVRLAQVDNKVLTTMGGTLGWSSVGNKGTYSDTSTSITAGSNYVASIALGCTPSKGRIILTNGDNQDNFAFVIFTTTKSEARSINGVATNSVEHGYSGGLSVVNSFGTNIKLYDAWIDGSTLKLEFSCSSGTQTLHVNESTWEVEM